jgi:hypothetical protein
LKNRDLIGVFIAPHLKAVKLSSQDNGKWGGSDIPVVERFVPATAVEPMLHRVAMAVSTNSLRLNDLAASRTFRLD